VLVTLLKRKR